MQRTRMMTSAFGFAAVLGIFGVANCGSSGNGGDGSGASAAMAAASAAGGEGGGTTAGSGGLLINAGQTNAGGDGTGTGNDCGAGCSGGQICVKGACQCPSYQSLCDGQCTPTSADPLNCGKCGNACMGKTACSGGTCTDSCLAPLTLCESDHTCSDTQNDNDHCGGCDTKCGAGKGCVKGKCVTSVPLGDPPGKCTGGGGPPIVSPSDPTECLGNIAATTFRWTLCSCKDVQLSDYILVDAFDSTMGPYKPGSTGGGVGANEKYHSSAKSVPPQGGIYGDLWTSSTQGINDSADELVKNIVKVGGPLQSSATMTVEGDVYANGDVPKGIDIGGDLYVPDTAKVGVKPAGKIIKGPVTFAPPCDCDAKQLVPIAAMVDAASKNNDNAAIGLDPDVLASPKTPTRLDLPCGSYYLSSIHPSIAVTIWAHGHVALYVGQDVQSSDDLTFGVDPTGSFDLFVAGKLGTSAGLTIGSPNYPALSRTYVGSTTGVSLSSAAYISGNIYAAYGLVHWSASTDAYGSIFAGDFSASAATRIHYDRAVLNAGDGCGGNTGSGGDSGVGGGGGTTMCGSCRDCNNQACINGECGSCQVNSDCCSPLACKNGECVPVVK